MKAKVNWAKAVEPLLEKYKDTKHPLEYKNLYQLVVMVVLAAQSTDKGVNDMAPALFKAYPDMASLSKATIDELVPYISKVRNFVNKGTWLIGIARQVQKDELIPMSLDALTALPGIGRKTANVILREAGKPPEGVIVDLHVVRVAPRLGIASGEDPKKIEQQLMDILPRKYWEAGMAMSFLGRDICRPTNPACGECVMNTVCAYYAAHK